MPETRPRTPSVTKEHSCTDSPLWRWELPAHADVEALLDRAAESGYVDHSPSQAVRMFRRTTGDMVVLVPRTRRVQIRVDYRLSVAGRADRAQLLAAELQAFIEEQP